MASAIAATRPVTKAFAPSSKKSTIPGLRFSMSAFPICRPRLGSLISRARAGGAGEGKRRGGEEMWRKNGATYHFSYNQAMARRIALVEDDSTIRQNYADALARAGYDVAAFGDRPSASRALATRLPELAIIDIGLGAEIDGGFALCRELRAASATLPILILSARDSDFDIVAGLRLGADDYLTKDVSLPHLLARIAALFRRAELAAQPQAAEERLERGALQLDLKRFSVTWRGTAVALTLTEFWMVHALCKF